MASANVVFQVACVWMFGVLAGLRRESVGRRCCGDRAQTSAEYALVLLGVGAVALLVLAWATKTGKVGDLLDSVFDSLIDDVA